MQCANRGSFVLAAATLLLALGAQAPAEERTLYGFEDEASLKGWTPTDLDALREAAKKALDSEDRPDPSMPGIMPLLAGMPVLAPGHFRLTPPSPYPGLFSTP